MMSDFPSEKSQKHRQEMQQFVMIKKKTENDKLKIHSIESALRIVCVVDSHVLKW